MLLDDRMLHIVLQPEELPLESYGEPEVQSESANKPECDVGGGSAHIHYRTVGYILLRRTPYCVRTCAEQSPRRIQEHTRP